MLDVDVVKAIIEDIVRSCSSRFNVDFRLPIPISCSDVSDPLWYSLVKTNPWHVHPKSLLSTARSVIVYAVPLSLKAIESNIEGEEPSLQWLKEYLLANKAIEESSGEVVEILRKEGFKSIAIKPTGEYDKKLLRAKWSHRHAGYITGLGTFGSHNLLITSMGCCVRLGTVITEAPVERTEKPNMEYCLERRGVECHKCIERCPIRALDDWSYGKYRCNDRLTSIAIKHKELLSGYADACGKCSVGLPCSTRIP